MRAIELHLIEDEVDAGMALVAGLVTSEDLADIACISCTEEVGQSEGSFYAYLIGLDGDDQWIVCLECAQDAINPTPGNLFVDEELEPLTFDEDAD